MAETQEFSPLAQALGRVPTGLFIVTTKTPSGPLGFVGSFVMQVGISPPILSVAVGRDREHLAAIRENGHFAISILDGESSGVMGVFFKKYEDGTTPFDHVEHKSSPAGLPVLAGALAWLECETTGEFDAGDHVVVFGRVVHGEKQHEGDPSIHLRKNGLGY